jgi:precorrin-2 dehydrogenase/sirohydrochlorin ferrochelatase
MGGMTYPIALDLSKITIVLIGMGEGLKRRQVQLLDAGATHLQLFEEMPADQVLQSTHIIMVVDMPKDVSRSIAEKAQAFGKLVNVEDVTELCDFHFTSQVRRGDLVLSVSTAGKSPTVARRIRQFLEQRFPESWAGWLDELAEYRLSLKAQNKSMSEILEASNQYIDEQGWIECKTRCKQAKE